ncbi:MAG: methionine--tRNA ligase [Acidobacteria bacterium]|nr:MAG: methionine--tRNA ligase [Acidobacteriota bacterium]
MNTFYATTPIYYANSLPHVGHLYTTVVVDCVVRARRQRGAETYFLTGTDEHGTNVQRAAARTGKTPKEHVDYIVGELQKMFAAFQLDGAHGGYDIFMRTTEPFHYRAVAEFWRACARAQTPKGREAIYKGFYEGWFCAPCATFKTEDEYAKPAREGEPPTCLIHETPLDRVSEESYFFRLSDYDEALLALYDARPDFVRPDVRRNEVISFVKRGLQDLSISRLKSSVSWAIPVPDDPAHTVYIWLDALTNYITALGWSSADDTLFQKFWPHTQDDEHTAFHFIGKDILRQHAIYWPAFLMAAGIEQPTAVIAHGTWVDQAARKLSKTLGNSIDINLLRRQFGIDPVRYFLLREMVFGQDSNFSYEALIARTNSDLASGLGNLVSRTLTMIERYCDGRVPSDDIGEAQRLHAKRAGVDADAQGLASAVELARDQFVRLLDEHAFSRALETAWTIIARVDKLISDAKPWELAKDKAQRQTLNAVLYRAAETLRWLAVMLYPFMPDSARAIWQHLDQTTEIEANDPAKLTWGGLAAGTSVGAVAPLFPRLDRAKKMAEIEKELAPTAGQQTAATNAQTPATSGAHATEADAVPSAPSNAETSPQPPMLGATEADAVPSSAAPEGVVNQIEIGDFAKVELRVGEVLTAERIPKSDKLLRFTVDLGEAQPRQILAGIAEHYEPETLVGRKLIFVANLKPRKLRGLESQGMVLAASVGDEGKPILATFTEDVPNGARLK